MRDMFKMEECVCGVFGSISVFFFLLWKQFCRRLG